MKIIIVGNFSLPTDIDKKQFLKKNDFAYNNNFHPYPWIYNLALGLSKINKNKVHIVSISNFIEEDTFFEHKNIKFHLLTFKIKKHEVIFLHYFSIKKLKKYIKDLKPDIIHAQSRGFITYAALKTKLPIVVTNHGQLKDHYKSLNIRGIKSFFQKKILFFFEKKVNKLTKYFIAVSPNTFNDCIKYTDINNVFLIDNAISDIFFDFNNVTFNNEILFVGIITNRKQVLELVMAIKKVDNVVLKITNSLSEKNTYHQKIKEYIINHNLQNKVMFIGHKSQKQLAELFSKATAVCLPSKYESFGMVLSECMATRTPVITSNTEGTTYVVKNNVNGLVFNVGNINELSDKINYLLKNKEKAKHLGANAKIEAIKRWKIENVARKSFEVYKKILKVTDNK